MGYYKLSSVIDIGKVRFINDLACILCVKMFKNVENLAKALLADRVSVKC